MPWAARDGQERRESEFGYWTGGRRAPRPLPKTAAASRSLCSSQDGGDHEARGYYFGTQGGQGRERKARMPVHAKAEQGASARFV